MSKTIGRDNIYREITDKIIAELEHGRAPWVQPWAASHQLCPLGLPVNGLTRRNYSGINILLLWSALEAESFASSYWLTFKQCIAMGGSVRKGQRGTHVYFADKFVPQKEKARAEQDGDEASAIAFLKRYTVFNAEQCDGLPVGLFGEVEPRQPREIVPEAEALIRATGADFRVGGDRAFYVPSEDFIRIPNQTAYSDQINYYRTAFHELGHWTGHRTRLDRNLTTKFGTVDYAREELIAEMATAFVCASLGIVPTVRHADYLGQWLQVLKEDARAIVRAASLASKACDFILAFKAEQNIHSNMEQAA
ncbi:MAG: zincin-like metallopeptidase domain-containing protein [Pseudomonadota bacterium]|nr:zincin-like metallopeptidase domain-containing protein [Pseudomonadota bacterium]